MTSDTNAAAASQELANEVAAAMTEATGHAISRRWRQAAECLRKASATVEKLAARLDRLDHDGGAN